jgi:type III restriction enzyme
MAKAKRIKTVEKLNLSEHTLDVNLRKCSYDKFRFSEIEEYVRAVTGGREYQYDAIKNTMIYLWGGGYKNVAALAKENFARKEHIRERFGSEEMMMGHLPLADRLSGVVHMATGTGKSYVIFAVAYLSVVMGLTKRVLVLGPSSTIIEEGLRDKFEDFMYRKAKPGMTFCPKNIRVKPSTF